MVIATKVHKPSPWLVGLVLAVGLMGMGLGAWLRLRTPPIGTTIEPPKLMPNFELRNQDNLLVHLSDLQGKPVLMIFGYTHCPDVCPLGLVDFKKVKAALGDQGAAVNYLFISVDGDRDTPDVLKRYMAAFDSQFMGLTERPFIVSEVAASYNAKFMRRISSTAQKEYLVSHTTETYLLDQHGNLRRVYPYAAPTDAIARDVKQLLDESTSSQSADH